MTKRITALTPAQHAAMPDYAQAWIEKGWRTGPLTEDEWAVQHAGVAHPEHGFSGIGAGTYEVRRQREQADEIRLVAD